ncbi:MAG: DNA-processing protein DprA [Proteobacteria bacterium]|nr:DNA-processing protein DprA [Pseudomonadota bacterium]
MADRAHQELLSWIRLTRSGGIGTKTFRQLLERFTTATEAIERLPEFVRSGGRPLKLLPAADAEREFHAAHRLGLTYVTWRHPHFPEPLKAIEDAPPLLVVKGLTEVLAQPMIAIVGARNATMNGRKMARILATGLVSEGLVVLSGMARGVDGAAHEGALGAAGGRTVAVLAGGTDVIYPPEHAKLHAQIAESGAVVSEMPPGTEPQAPLFPRRNRIISGASAGVVVVEATLRSGSLITARLAADQGRDVFAVPGSPLDPRAHGPNSLIRDGAILVQSKDDILDNLPLKRATGIKKSPGSHPVIQAIENNDKNMDGDLRLQIESALGSAPAAVDELVRQCQVSAAIVATVLMEMELAGRLERLPGNRVALVGKV